MILLTIFCWFSFYSGTIKFVFQGVVWSIIKCGMQTLFSRVYIDGKRVSNTLYGPCKMFSERHVSGIYTLTNSIHIANYGYGLECKLMREFSQTLFSVLPLPMPSLSIFLWCNDVVTNSAQTTPTRYALNFSWGEPWSSSSCGKDTSLNYDSLAKIQ